VIAAEDTRNTIHLLTHFDIHTPMTSYHEYNKIEKAKVLVEKLLAGQNIALVTDAGTPGISDPGEELVRQAYAAHVSVTSLPGACACVTALTLSGLPTRRFAFEAFLPSDKKERQAIYETLPQETRTIIIYEAPHRLKTTLRELYQVMGDRRLSLCRELTKIHEEVQTMLLSQALHFYETTDPRGEYVLVFEGADRFQLQAKTRERWVQMPLEKHMTLYTDKGISKKDAMKQVAADRGVSKREIYAQLLEQHRKEQDS
jgi:16S rRNA (cytidine1402-2'-O)-methyltransferase